MSLFAFVLLLVLAIVPVLAQGSVPENGSFSGDAVGWSWNGSNRVNCGYDGSVGHSANGSLHLTGACYGYSMPIRPTGSSSLTFWARLPSGNGWLQLYDLDASSMAHYDWTGSASWTQYTYDLSGYSGKRVMLRIGGDGWFDDFAVTNASTPFHKFSDGGHAASGRPI